MLDIQLEGLNNEIRMKLLPREQEVVKELEQNGTIVHSFIKLDMSGIFIAMMATDSEDVHSKLSTLPYYPFMKIEIIPVRAVSTTLINKKVQHQLLQRKIGINFLNLVDILKKNGLKYQAVFYYCNKSGRRSCVRLMDCSIRQSLIFFSWPESNTSGTFQPSNSAGRVYTGGAKRLS